MRVVVLIFILLLASCRAVPVAEDLNQTEANQIVALFNTRGIASYSKRETSGKPVYSVEVDRSYYALAKNLLAERNLPGPRKAGIDELLEPQGFLPNTREMEALRLDHALAREVEEVIVVHPLVTNVKVIVRNHSAQQPSERGASIFVETVSGNVLDRSELIEIVARALPGISKDKIYIKSESLVAEDNTTVEQGLYNKEGKLVRVALVPFLFNWHVPESDYNAMVIVLIICFIILAMIGGLVGYWFGYYQHSKNYIDMGLPDMGPRSLRLERVNRDMPEV